MANTAAKGSDWEVRRNDHQRHNSRPRLRHTPLAAAHTRQQTTDAGIRQTDDLLPALDADARRHPRHPRHHHAGRQRIFPTVTERRLPMGYKDILRRSAKA